MNRRLPSVGAVFLPVTRSSPRGGLKGISDRRAGFTLIEVLAALVITSAFVAVVLPYAGRLATHWWVGETTVEAADGWMQAVSRLGEVLCQGLPYGFCAEGTMGAVFGLGQFMAAGLLRLQEGRGHEA